MKAELLSDRQVRESTEECLNEPHRYHPPPTERCRNNIDVYIHGLASMRTFPSFVDGESVEAVTPLL